MRRPAAVALAAVALVALVAVLLLVAQPGLPGARPQVVATESAWGAVGPEGSELVTTLVLRNPNPVAVPLQGLRYEVAANGQRLGAGSAVDPGPLPANGDRVLRLVTVVPHDAALAWWPTHVANGERSEVVLAGEATLVVAGQALRVPFREARTWETDLLGRLQGFANCAPGTAAPCVAGGTHRWAPDGMGLVSELQVRNPLPLRLPADALSLDLRLHGVGVAHGAPAGGGALPAGGEGNLTVVTRFDPAGLRAWWPLHVRDCERSDAELVVRFDLGGFVRGTVPRDLGTLATGLVCEAA